MTTFTLQDTHQWLGDAIAKFNAMLPDYDYKKQDSEEINRYFDKLETARTDEEKAFYHAY